MNNKRSHTKISRKIALLVWVYFSLLSAGITQPCTFTNLSTDGFEYSTQIPGIVPATVYHPNPSTYAARTGAKGVYMNFVNNLPGNSLVMSRVYDVCPGYQYKMSTWFKEINGGSSTVTTRIKDGNGTILTTSTTTYFAGGGWGQWVSPSVTAITGTIQFELIFVSGVGNNDFGMDDLSIDICTTSALSNSVDICSNSLPINLFDSVTNISSTSGLWSGPSTLLNGYLGTFDPSVMLGGNYTYTVSSPVQACPDSVVEFAMDVGQAPLVDLGPDTLICIGDSIIFDVFNNNSSYLWQDGSTASTLVANTAGIYWVEVTNGCSIVSTDTVNVGITPYPSINLGQDTILCVGDSLNLDVYQMGATYNWSTGQQDSAITLTSSQTTWVELTLNSCTSVDSIDVIFNPMPVVNLGVDTAICTGDSLVWNVLNPGANYLWHNGLTTSSFETGSAGQYWVEITLANCVISDSINISVNPIPVVDLGPNLISCDGDNIYLDAFTINGTYLWDDGSNSNNLMVTQTGTHWVDVTVNQCHGYDTVEVTFYPLPIIDLGPDTLICSPDSIWLNATYGNSSYQWNTGATTAYVNTGSAGLYAVTVTEFICSYSDSIVVTVEPKPLADLGADTILCEGTSITKGNIVSGAGYLWQDGSASAFFQIIEDGYYWVEVTKGLCKNSDSIWVKPFSVPEVSLGEDTVLCVGDQILLMSDAQGDVYQWSNGGNDTAIWVSNAGLYWLEVSNICGLVRDEIEISEVTLPQFELGSDTTICLGEVVELEVYWPNADSYLWDDGTDLPYFSIYEEGDYLLEVTNLCGAVRDSIRVDYVQCDCNVFIPNAFTPNGDDLDEDFGPQSYCEFGTYQFFIYDRWGLEVFYSNDPMQKWDGTLLGKPLAADVYSYVLKFNYDKKGPKTRYKSLYGTVVIIK